MKYKIVLFLLCSSTCIFSMMTNLYAENRPSYQRIIIFGDSYSDNGNDFKLTKQLYPNPVRYFKGRFSDGPVWAEYFADRLHIDPNGNQFIDFAYGQAKVLSTAAIQIKQGNISTTYTVPSLLNEIGLYLKQYKTFAPDDLVIVFIATNDFFDLPLDHIQAFFKKIAHQETNDIRFLIHKGAKHIIVFNGRDVSYSPLAIMMAGRPASGLQKKALDTFLKDYKKYIEIYNRALSTGLAGQTGVFIYNIYEFDNRAVAKIKAGGLSYQMDGRDYIFKRIMPSCYQNNKGDYQGIAGPVCRAPWAYFFYDRVHTTHYLNYVLANDVYERFIQN